MRKIKKNTIYFATLTLIKVDNIKTYYKYVNLNLNIYIYNVIKLICIKITIYMLLLT